MTIDVKVTPNQNVDITIENTLQEIDVANALEEEIDIIEQDGSQDINIENAPEQDVGVKQDIKTIKIYNDFLTEYEGEYEVTPQFVPQTLPTAEKILMKDVTIEEIPYAEVSNNSGGITAIIG